MPYSDTREEVFNYFEDRESEAIEAWLERHGYKWDFPTLCGSCCGYWDQQYWLSFRPADVEAFNAFAAKNEVWAVASPGSIRIGDPTGGAA